MVELRMEGTLSPEQIEELKRLFAESGNVKLEPLTDCILVDQTRYEALERLYEATKNWRYGLIDKKFDKSTLACAYPAVYRLASTFDEVERVKGDTT